MSKARKYRLAMLVANLRNEATAMKLFLVTLSFIFMSSISTVKAEGENHLLTISVCPEWKKGTSDEQTALMRGACKTTSQNIKQSFLDSMSIDENNIYQLIDETATYSNVSDKMAWLNENTNPDDTVFIYLLAHGGALRGHYKGYPVQDQGIALWSVEEPNIATATDQKIWMLARTFRDLADYYHR